MEKPFICPLCKDTAEFDDRYTCEWCEKIVCGGCAYSRDYGYICQDCKEQRED